MTRPTPNRPRYRPPGAFDDVMAGLTEVLCYGTAVVVEAATE